MNDKVKSELLSIWVMVFSAACIGLIVWRTVVVTGGAQIELRHVVALAILGLTFLLGFWSLAAPSGPRTWEPMLKAGQAFLAAWTLFFGRRWLLYFFGSVALINLAGGFLETAATQHYLGSYVERTLHGTPFDSAGHQFLLLRLGLEVTERLPHTIATAASGVFPNLGFSESVGGQIVFCLAAAVLGVWVARRLKLLSKDNGTGPQAALVSGLTMPLVVVFAAAAFSLGWSNVRWMAQLASETAPGTTAQLNIIHLLALVANAARFLFFWPLLVGGLIGSLQRNVEGEEVTADSFLRSAVRHFGPMAGVFLILWLVELVLQSPLAIVSLSVEPNSAAARQVLALSPLFWLVRTLAYLLLAFAPLAIVLGRMRMNEGVQRGFRMWRERKLASLSFAALAATLAVTVSLLETSMWHALVPSRTRYMTAGSILMSLLTAMVGVLLAAVLLIAVWEFYRAVAVPESAEPQVMQSEA